MNGVYVSFAARHPFRDLSCLLAPLGVVPRHCWQAGDQRRTPTGMLLEGTYDLSYSSSDLPLPASNDLADWLKRAVIFLRPVANELASFVDGGGSLCFYVGLENGTFEGTKLSPELMTEIGALRISLEIDQSL